MCEPSVNYVRHMEPIVHTSVELLLPSRPKDLERRRVSTTPEEVL